MADSAGIIHPRLGRLMKSKPHAKSAAPKQPQSQAEITDAFHRLYYETKTFKRTYWLGKRSYKTPLDMWIIQEILYEVRPDLIVECGTLHGGSAFFYATICDLLGTGRILGIDLVEQEGRPQHERVTYLNGSTVSDEVLSEVRRAAQESERVMVLLDSDHHAGHVLRELEAYSEFVTVGSYLVVEDTNINGHPVAPGFGPGPTEAVERFLAERDDFVIDRSKEKFHLTFNPGGYLRRVR
jgi:cephalosporin hydroxylase